MGRKYFQVVLIATFFCLLSGCQLKHWATNKFLVGPNYCRPNAPVAVDWQDSPDRRVNLSLPNHVDWWSNFNDPVLNRLVDSARQQNLTLKQTGWRIQQARDVRRIITGNLFPQIQQASGAYNRLLTSQATALPAPIKAFDDWSVGAGLAWEVDVWGRFRRSVASADADVQVAEGDYDFVQLSLIADVAETYNLYRVFEQRLEYVRQNIEIQEGLLKISNTKAEKGKTGFTAVHLGSASLEAVRSLEPLLEAGKRQTNNALCLLMGMPTQDLSQLLGDGIIPNAPAEVAVGIPADLLRRRPDIRAAERAIAAQSEQVGIALADLYPSFTITGNIGWDAEKFGDLFGSAANTGAVGPSFRWNILNYGRILANVDLQESGLQALILNYQNTVLEANREVEDSLVAFLKNQERVQHIQKSAVELKEALRLVTIRYEEGDRDYTLVYVMQRELVSVLDQLASAKGDVVESLIKLYKALGGGWEVRCPNASVRDMQVGYTDDSDTPEMMMAPSHSEAPYLSLEDLGNKDVEKTEAGLSKKTAPQEDEELKTAEAEMRQKIENRLKNTVERKDD
uniref:Toluene efflux pump outer membrane protein TtgF n=1 Tax=Fuerstiella marisgermanici TaxID=1891926 RepID=A0A1P8WC23_9PLAN|nr:TolC family protein [Fuerstiella marisgermanici]APZ91573.1 Toluene efflux pump outer membrane protein TtgF precursor [Fuerstiella marisgermanici]